MIDTDATDAIKEKTQEEIDAERVQVTKDAELTYAKALQVEADYANQLEAGLD